MGKWHEKRWEGEVRRSWWLGPSSGGNRFRPPVLPVKASSVRLRSSDVSPGGEGKKAPGSGLAVQINREEVLTLIMLTPSHMYTHMTFNRSCTHNYTLIRGAHAVVRNTFTPSGGSWRKAWFCLMFSGDAILEMRRKTVGRHGVVDTITNSSNFGLY